MSNSLSHTHTKAYGYFICKHITQFKPITCLCSFDYVHISVQKSPSHKLVTIFYYNPTNLFKEAETEENSKLYPGEGGGSRAESSDSLSVVTGLVYG